MGKQALASLGATGEPGTGRVCHGLGANAACQSRHFISWTLEVKSFSCFSQALREVLQKVFHDRSPWWNSTSTRMLSFDWS